eukprot:12303023-Alexandrium_andersonii.AAC.1
MKLRWAERNAVRSCDPGLATPMREHIAQNNHHRGATVKIESTRHLRRGRLFCQSRAMFWAARSKC